MKDFRQRRPDGKGGWIWNLDGVQRVLYRLPEVVAGVARKERIFIVEGEKDADAVVELGLVATCNPGGAGKWQDDYGADLVGSDCVVLADRDEPGRKHAKAVAEAISIGARSVRIIELPAGKDVSDWITAGGTKLLLEAIIEDTPEWQSGEKVILTARDLADEYREILAKRKAGDPESIGWPMGIHALDREMVYSPGDLILVAGTAGTGKTAFLQTLERRAPVPTLFFSIEMSRQQLMNRRMAALTGIDSWKIRRGALSETEYAQLLDELERFAQDDDHAIVDNPSLTTSALEHILRIARVRFGVRVAYVDHVGRLTDRDGDSGYDRMSNIAKALSRIARVTNTCVTAAAQVNRQAARANGEPPQKSEMRESGVLEEEAAIVLALGRAEGSADMKLAVRKNRHGLDGFTIPLTFDLLRAQLLEPNEVRVSGQRAPQEIPF